MMGRRERDQAKLFYEFRLEDRVPKNHLLRRIDVVVTAALADLHKELEPHYSVFEVELAEPAIGEVQFDFLGEPALGTDAIAIADDEHAHHQLGIDGWAPDVSTTSSTSRTP